MKILIYEFKLFIDSPLFGTIFFHEEEINENKKGKENLAILLMKKPKGSQLFYINFACPV